MTTLSNKKKKKTKNTLISRTFSEEKIRDSAYCVQLPLAENVPAVNEDKPKIFKSKRIFFFLLFFFLQHQGTELAKGKVVISVLTSHVHPQSQHQRVCSVPGIRMEGHWCVLMDNITNSIILKTIKGKRENTTLNSSVCTKRKAEYKKLLENLITTLAVP